MKLISEIVENVQVISEGTSKDLYIEGVFLQSEMANKNKRIYPKSVMEKEVARYMKEYVESKRAFGELGHPEGPTINLDRVSHIITSLREDGNNYIGRAKILNTPMGNIVKGLIEGGAQLGVSSRGMGTLKEKEDGINEVQSDFYLATAADIVADPSAPDAFVQGIMENKEWMFINGSWTYQNIDETKKLMEQTKKKQLEEVKLRVFENFLNSLKK
jgi:Prohead core protein serine protease